VAWQWHCSGSVAVAVCGSVCQCANVSLCQWVSICVSVAVAVAVAVAGWQFQKYIYIYKFLIFSPKKCIKMPKTHKKFQKKHTKNT
jgi:hypothetical protein